MRHLESDDARKSRLPRAVHDSRDTLADLHQVRVFAKLER